MLLNPEENLSVRGANLLHPAHYRNPLVSVIWLSFLPSRLSLGVAPTLEDPEVLLWMAEWKCRLSCDAATMIALCQT
jgi:hypothetical protein